VPENFLIQAHGTLTALPAGLTVAAGATASVAQNAVPFTFPTIQGIVGQLTTALNNALSSVLGGTPLTIQAGVDTTAKTLSFDIKLAWPRAPRKRFPSAAVSATSA
jgi:hypothetical protein